MRNIIRTSVGIAFVILGVMTFVFDFMTARNGVDIVSEDPYPLQWASIVAAILCAGGFALLSQITEQQLENSSESEKVFEGSYSAKINWWTSFKEGLNNNLDELGHVLKIFE